MLSQPGESVRLAGYLSGHANSFRYGQHLLGGMNASIRLSDECCTRARLALNTDEPTIENLQTCLLLSNAFFQAGKGKRSYMLLCKNHVTCAA